MPRSCARASTTAATSAAPAACTTATCQSSARASTRARSSTSRSTKADPAELVHGVAWLNTELDKACLDVNEFGWICGWVMECQEKGYIGEKQLGFRLGWGDIKGAARLIQMISHRQGFGNLLAEGVKRAAEKLGSPAKDCAIYTERGAAPRGHDHRARWDEMLDTCTAATGTLESGVPVHPTEVGQPARMNTFDVEAVAKFIAAIRGR